MCHEVCSTQKKKTHRRPSKICISINDQHSEMSRLSHARLSAYLFIPKLVPQFRYIDIKSDICGFEILQIKILILNFHPIYGTTIFFLFNIWNSKFETNFLLKIFWDYKKIIKT